MQNFKYIISKTKLQEQLNKYQERFKVYFPVKSNNCRELIQLLDKSQSYFEVETLKHAELLINEYGIDARRMLFCPMYDTIEQIKSAIGLGINFFVITSPDEALFMKRYTESVRYLIRLRSDQIVPDTTAFRPFGAKKSDIDEIIGIFSNAFCGFSFYISQETRQSLSANKVIADFFEGLYDKYRYCTINIGGGFLVNDAIELQQKLNGFFSGDLIIEPGRHLLDPCIGIEATIIQKTQNEELTYLTLNVGIYNGLIDSVIKNKRFDITFSGSEDDLVKYVVLGPTADTSDRLGEYFLPNDLKIGDRLILRNCGAYCEVLSTNFCGYNRFNIVVK